MTPIEPRAEVDPYQVIALNVYKAFDRVTDSWGWMLELEVEGGFAVFACGAIDPANVAGALLSVTDLIIKETARDRGLDAIEVRSAQRKARRQVQRIRSTDNAELDFAHCAYCQRTATVIDSGVRYCKRHAREHGVLVRGKIT